MTPIKYIAIIEDDPITTLIIKKSLEKNIQNVTLKSFKNGQEAYQSLVDEYQTLNLLPDLILLDINMPVMNGWEFLDAFQKVEKSKSVPVVMLTSSIDLEDINKSKQYTKVKGYFSKPLDNEKIQEMLSLVSA